MFDRDPYETQSEQEERDQKSDRARQVARRMLEQQSPEREKDDPGGISHL